MFQAWLDQQKVVPCQTKATTELAAERMTEAELCQP
jgi:hypothetical protein